MISAFYHLDLDAQLGRRVGDGTVYLDNGMGGWVIDGQRKGAVGGCRLKKKKKRQTALRTLQGQN